MKLILAFLCFGSIARADLSTPPLRLLDEALQLGSASELNFAGSGVTCARAGKRVTCTVGAPTLQGVYNASPSGLVQLDATRLGLVLKAFPGQTDSIFELQNQDGFIFKVTPDATSAIVLTSDTALWVGGGTEKLHLFHYGAGGIELQTTVGAIKPLSADELKLQSDTDILIDGATRFTKPANWTRGTVIASASTIAITAPIVHISGTAQINLMNPPNAILDAGAGYAGQVVTIPDDAFSWGTGGNIVIPGVAVVGQPIVWTYDGGTSRWYPSYSSSGPAEITDPGAGGAIPVTSSGTCSLVPVGAAETRTIAAPAFVGEKIVISNFVWAGGGHVVTAAHQIDTAGHTTMTFDGGGATIVLESVRDNGSSPHWRVTGNDSVTLGP